MHVPVETIVNVAPETLQTNGVDELKVTGNPDVALAESMTGVELKTCVPGLAKVIDWLAKPDTVKVNACICVPLALVAEIVSGKVPVAVGVPDKTPVMVFKDAALIPAGKVPVTLNEVAPGATTVKVLAAFTANVALAALVKMGKGFLFSVNDAEIACSVGTVVCPHVPSASTATTDTGAKLMT